MAYKFERMLKLLNKIDRGDKAKAQALADDFEIDVRSVERDIKTLRNAGFPIQYDRSRGCYVFDEGYSLRRADLSKEETLTLALAKSMLKQFGGKTGKILDIIEKKLGTNSAILPDHIVLGEQNLPPVVEDYFRRLNAAILDSHQVEIDYRATSKNDEKTSRIVDPYYLLFKDNMWYMRGFCRLRKELRLFALDKIDSLTVLDKYFVKKVNLVAGEELAGAACVVLDGEPVDVVLRFDEKMKPYMLRAKWFPSQKNKELPDGRLEMKLRINGFVGLKSWIYRWIPYVEVVEPKELREEMRKDVVAAAGRIGGKF